jgi:hypothetical protein
MHDAVRPKPSYAERPGRWVAESAWPSPTLESRCFALTKDGLAEAPGERVELACGSTYAHGLDGGSWIAWGTPVDFARDQRAEDGRALSFTSAPLDQDLELLGSAEVALILASDRPNALVAARLCDVWPDGASTLVTFGVLNLTHRESHENPTALIPGDPVRVTLRLDSMAYSFPAGHRIRLALSPTLWPWVWPSPEPVTLTLFAGDESELLLSVRRPRSEDGRLAPFEEPEGPPPLAIDVLGAGKVGRALTHDVATGRWDLAADLTYFGSFRIVDADLEHRDRGRDTFSIVEGNPLSAQARSEWSIAVGRGEWRTRVETLSTMTADSATFRVTNAVDAYEGDVRIFAKTWSFSVPRDLV